MLPTRTLYPKRYKQKNANYTKVIIFIGIIMVLVNSTHNYDFKNIFFESKFGLNSLIKYDKHIGTRQLIRYWVEKIKHNMINITVTMVVMIILISLYDLVC